MTIITEITGNECVTWRHPLYEVAYGLSIGIKISDLERRRAWPQKRTISAETELLVTVLL